MVYETAIQKSWKDLKKSSDKSRYSVKLLCDSYNVNLKERTVLSSSCNIPVKSHAGILILHYLAKKLKGLHPVSGEWISFKELEGGEGYYPTFKKRVIEPIMRKYGTDPDSLLALVERFNAKRTRLADISIAFEVFEGVLILINFWRGDNEFGPEANVLFDRGIKEMFCTEDIVVLSEIVVHSI